jgi:hypothetical protein
MAAEPLVTRDQQRGAVVNLADYRATRRAAPRAAFNPAWLPSVRRVPASREIAHRQLMLQHLTARARATAAAVPRYLRPPTP